MLSSPISILRRNWWIALFVLALDQFSKWWVVHFLPPVNLAHYWYPYGGIAVFQDFFGIEFSINHMTNTGAAWGAFGNHQIALLIVRLVLIAALALYLFRYNTHAHREIPLALILAGAVGNVVDFFTYGHVIDMLHVVLWGWDFPVFNIADSAISIGIASLIILSPFEK